MVSHKLISPHQHGFLCKHSRPTCSNLLETVSDWTLAFDNHLQTDVTYIDFQKAFDSHSKLIAKLESYDIKGDLLCWIKAFLAHRSQQVNVGNALSDFLSRPTSSGVPQAVY